MKDERQEEEGRAEVVISAEFTAAGDETRLLPLVVGGLAEAGDLLRVWMHGDQGEEPGGDETLRQAAVGVAAKTAENLARTRRATGGLSRRFGRFLFAPGRAVGNSRPLRPLRRQFDQLVERGEAEVEAWIAKGQETEAQGRQMARATLARSTQEIVKWAGAEPAVEALIDKQVARVAPALAEVPQLDEAVQRLADDYMAHLSQQPPQALEELLRAQIQWAIADLYQNPPPALRQLIHKQIEAVLPELLGMEDLDDVVRQVANNYIAYLDEHPERVQALIQKQGDVYITYLTQNPEQVQTLVQGQSKGLVSEVTDEVRARTVTADNTIESLVRSLLGRGKREQIALPDEVEGEG